MADDGNPWGGDIEIPIELPVLPLRNSVIFPGSILPIDVYREGTLAAVRRAGAMGMIAVVSQKDKTDETSNPHLHDVGCAARILKTINLQKDKLCVIIQGLRRVWILDVDRTGVCFVARVDPIAEPDEAGDEIGTVATLKTEAKRLLALMPGMPKEANELVDGIEHAGQLADVLASHLDLSIEEKQRLLETIPLAQRLDLVRAHIERATAALVPDA